MTIRFQRNNQTYRMLVSICQLIIEGMLITTDAGDYRLASFVDEQRMCRLYEKFILEYYTRHYPALSVRASQIPWSLDDGVGTMLPVMQSDIHLQRGNTVLIIDAKYYSHTTQVKFDKHTLHSNNLYQIYSDSELEEDSTIRNFRIVQTEGSRQVTRDTKHYNLQMIIAVGFKVNNERAVQFRKWANGIVKDYTIKGWVMDDERLKNGGSVLTVEYFDRLLEQIREIRLSERRFYQKITDIYATALDYDRTAKTTKQFFAKVQNKMHYAVHGHTAAELIYERADADKPHMGLTTWAAAPEGKKL